MRLLPGTRSLPELDAVIGVDARASPKEFLSGASVLQSGRRVRNCLRLGGIERPHRPPSARKQLYRQKLLRLTRMPEADDPLTRRTEHLRPYSPCFDTNLAIRSGLM